MAERPQGGPSAASHPLMGASLPNLIRLLGAAGPIPARRWPLVAAFLGSALARAPLSLLEGARNALSGEPELEAPVFIVGHWRSGTTHLHNVMGKDPQFGHISPLVSGLPQNVWSIVGLLRPLLEKALPEDRHVDNVAVTPDSPQEDEIPLASLQPLSVFTAVYFPHRFREHHARGVFFDGASTDEIERWALAQRRFLASVARQQRKPRLLIKNPVYTGRLALLRERWPGARFVHIVRNPYEVYLSTVRYYKRLIPDLALQPFDALDVEEMVLDTYARIMARYDAQAADLSASEVVEVRFEEFERDPLGELARVYDQLECASGSMRAGVR
jgi:hypothetical protein